MSTLTVNSTVIAATTTSALSNARANSTNWRSDSHTLHGRHLTNEVLEDLAQAADTVGDAAFGRVVASIQLARTGEFKAIPSLRAAPQVMVEFLRHDMIDGWLYVRDSDGHLHPYLVTQIELRDRRGEDKPYLNISLEADDPTEKTGRKGHNLTFAASDVARKKPADVLLAGRALKETEDLRSEYEARRVEHQRLMADGFAQQYRFTGRPLRASDSWKQPHARTRAKVIHDIAPAELRPLREYGPSILHGPDGSDAVGPLPVITSVRVFDLGTHDFLDVNASDLTAYAYDKTLGDKLILPADQRELLDILTTDIHTFVGDIVDGKSAGNVILGKGEPGVGKTLTAEVYAELIERPLYSIHSGSLGVDAASVRKNLETVFQRSARWNTVLLLDEADVFVLQRGTNITQNAIVAEFLRTLEYFDGLLFMTTNRPDDIDDAILSRCAAIIDYRAPGPEDARKVWQVLAANQRKTLPDELLDELVEGFPNARPRDIKMLLRLALRVAAHRNEELTVDLFARCAMFRGLHYGQGAS